ncbi:hypothetical protein [Deinococcus ruber]|uniref:Uncharacterized protein n=1 Tax=Deinococcus ruber TaxID=1848197 RepID=A0A918KXP1_9DEIO|nr:hypothetical protein [Deinococcus ruber]GGR41030.1 hypothetical protein GCM10008957_56510 [Deinococcus ruber]
MRLHNAGRQGFGRDVSVRPLIRPAAVNISLLEPPQDLHALDTVANQWDGTARINLDEDAAAIRMPQMDGRFSAAGDPADIKGGVALPAEPLLQPHETPHTVDSEAPFAVLVVGQRLVTVLPGTAVIAQRHIPLLIQVLPLVMLQHPGTSGRSIRPNSSLSGVSASRKAGETSTPAGLAGPSGPYVLYSEMVPATMVDFAGRCVQCVTAGLLFRLAQQEEGAPAGAFVNA